MSIVRGRANEAVKKLYQTVWSGQKIGFEKIRTGVPTADVHKSVQDFFVQQSVRNFAFGNGQSQAFHNGSFPDASFTNKNRIVFASAV